MNVGPDHHEPLDAEERALAERLARIGPFDGPSPALDAKILKAAHAVANKRGPSRQRHWLALMGLPPALVTGVGVAAAAVLALGLVWQLRPAPVLQPAMDEDGSASGEEVFVMAEPLPEPRSAAVNPPPLPTEAPVRAPALPQHRQSRAQAEVAARSEAADKAAESTASTAEAVAAVAADAAAEAAPSAAPDLRERGDAATAGAEAMHEPGFVAAPPAAPATPPAAAKRRATYTNSARATATRREADAYSAPAPAAQSVPSQAAGAESGQELDRIEVTGSRVAAPDPVRNDTRLEPAEWLERIRARRDAGELDAARESLQLFRKQYPRIRVPDDLRALLVADPDR